MRALLPGASWIMRISFDSSLERIDLTRVHSWLKDTYWAKDQSLEKVKRAFRSSTVVVGAYSTSKELVGVARCISDTTRFGYIADVYVDRLYRRQGIALKMLKHLMDHAKVKQTEYWYLLTKDAQPVYAKLGFAVFDKPERFMRLNRKKSR